MQNIQAQASGISFQEQKICRGGSVALSALYYNVPSHIEVINWYSGASVVYGSVSPLTTTTYTLYSVNKINGQEYRESLTVYVDQPPSFSIELKDSLCPGTSIQLAVSHSVNTGSIHWYGSDGNIYPDQSIITPNQDISFTVRGTSNNSCANIFEKTHRIHLIKLPSANDLKILDWEAVKICENCQYNLPTQEGIRTNADTINIQAFSWNSLPPGPPFVISLPDYTSASTLNYTAKVSASLSFKSTCGKISKVFTDYPLKQTIHIEHCSPDLILASPPPICFCNVAILSVSPGNKDKCNFDPPNITWTSLPLGANVEFRSQESEEIFYQTQPSVKTNYTAQIQFKTVCQSSSDIQNLTKSLSISIEPDKCPPSVKYENCPGGVADLVFTSNSPSKLIQSVEILAPHQNLFDLIVASPGKHEFKTKSPISLADDPFYNKISYAITYQLTNCNPVQNFQKDSIVSLSRKLDCRPSLSIVYPPYPDAGYDDVCFGDTAFLQLKKTSNNFVLDSVVYSFDKASSYGKRNEKTFSLNSTMIEYYLFTYVETNKLYAQVFYKDNGLACQYVDTLIFKGRNCPCKLELFDDLCAGTDNNIRFKIENHAGSLVNPIVWETTPPTKVDFISSSYDKKKGWTYYSYLARPMEKTSYNASITYLEGDSLRNIRFENIRSKTVSCPPTLESSLPILCENENLLITIYANNPADSIIDVEWVGSSKNPIKFIEKTEQNNKINFYYELQVSSHDILIARIKARNNDTVLVYQDTVDVLIHPQPRAFRSDTLFACHQTDFDLADYVNTDAVSTIDYYGTLNNSSTIHQSEKSKTYQVICKSKYLCKSMSGNTSFTDSIHVITETKAWGTAQDFKACSGIATNLNNYVTINPDAYCTWIILPQDTVAKALKKNQAALDTLYADTEYALIIHNACAHSEELRVNANVFQSPIIGGKDTLSACVGDSLSLQASVTGDPLGLIENPQWSYNNRIYPEWSPRIFISDTQTLEYTFRCISKYSGDFSCESSKNFVIKANTKPKLSLHFSIPLTKDSILCVHAKEKVDIAVTGAYNYKWQDSSAYTLFPNKISADSNTSYRLIGIDEKACSSTISFLYTIKTVDYSPKDTMVCRSESLRLAAGDLHNTFYTWSFKGQNLANTRHLDIASVQIADTGNYILYTNKDQCLDTNYIQISLHPSPYSSFSKDSLRLCEYTELQLKPLQYTADSCLWINPQGDASKLSELFIDSVSLIKDTGLYQFVSYLKSCRDTAKISVHIDQKSYAGFIFDSTKFYCSKTDLMLLANPIPPDTGILYFWKTANRIEQHNKPVHTMKNLQKADEGPLWLIIHKNTCKDSISQNLKIQVSPEPILSYDTMYCQADTVVLRVSNIAPNSTHQWKYKGNIVSVDSILKIDNIQKNQEGTYFYTNKEADCLSEEKNAVLKLQLLPYIHLEDSAILCSGDTLRLSSELSGASYRWQDGSTSPVFYVNEGGLYSLEVILNACSSKDTTFVIERPKPQFSLGRDTTVCNGEIVWLRGPQGMDAYLWQEKSGEDTYEVKEEGLYVLQVFKEDCSFTDSTEVFYKFCGRFYLASAFTPNNDGLNDVFGVITNAKPHEVRFRMSIYERNGKIVFESNSLEKFWDGTSKGKLCPTGTYVYIIEATDIKSGKDLSSTGSVNLIR